MFRVATVVVIAVHKQPLNGRLPITWYTDDHLNLRTYGWPSLRSMKYNFSLFNSSHLDQVGIDDVFYWDTL